MMYFKTLIFTLIVCSTIFCLSSCKKPSGDPLPSILDGNWFIIPSCETCCESSLTLSSGDQGIFKTVSTSFSANDCDFEKKGDVLFDSQDSIIWIGRHELEISSFKQVEEDDTGFNFGTGYRSMQVTSDKGQSGIYYNLD